jgi:hypothetical protein
MVTFLSAAKKTRSTKGTPTTVRYCSVILLQLRVLRKNNQTIQTPMLRCLTAYTTATEMPFGFLRRFSRNTDRTTNKIKVDIARPVLSDPRVTQTGSEGTSSSCAGPAYSVPTVADYATFVQDGTKNICFTPHIYHTGSLKTRRFFARYSLS